MTFMLSSVTADKYFIYPPSLAVPSLLISNNSNLTGNASCALRFSKPNHAVVIQSNGYYGNVARA